MHRRIYIPSEYIKRQAEKIGFQACGISEACELSDFTYHLRKWIASGFHADMNYMESYFEKRCNPTLLMEDSRSVISVLLSYKPSQQLSEPPFIAQYAYGEDYHIKIKRMLFELIAAIQLDYPHVKAIPFVDTAPISDKYWAAKSGLGWLGKNTLLIHPIWGSLCNIGELVTNIQTEYDRPIENKCGDCTLCIESCPNGALKQNEGLDARRCIAYHTIENRDEVLPETLHLAGYAFGCDCCQNKCPYNARIEAQITVSDEQLNQLRLLKTANASQFKKITQKTAMNRIRYTQWKRNIDALYGNE